MRTQIKDTSGAVTFTWEKPHCFLIETVSNMVEFYFCFLNLLKLFNEKSYKSVMCGLSMDKNLSRFLVQLLQQDSSEIYQRDKTNN